MVCCENRTDRLAWGFIAMLAKYRHEANSNVGELSLEVALDPDPVDRATLCGLSITGDSDIVLGVACDNAGFATGTEI